MCPEVLHESGFFSAYRAYLQVRREFSELLVCAAPVGNSYLISVRKIDRFPHTKWFHYVILPFFALPALIAGAFMNGILGGILVLAVFVALVWSVCRYADSHILIRDLDVACGQEMRRAVFQAGPGGSSAVNPEACRKCNCPSSQLGPPS